MADSLTILRQFRRLVDRFYNERRLVGEVEVATLSATWANHRKRRRHSLATQASAPQQRSVCRQFQPHRELLSRESNRQ